MNADTNVNNTVTSWISKTKTYGISLMLASGLICAGVQTAFCSPPDVESRARQIIAQMTLDEKVAQLHGVQNKTEFRTVPGLARLGIPALPLCNGPAGIGPAGPGHEGKATALPAPISLAATWDTQAARLYGRICGSEAADLGNVLLESPDVNIARTPNCGRTFEAFGEDPFLVGQIAVADIQGIQSCGVIANVKHFAANNQEENRYKVDEMIDERTLREIYLPAFETAIKEGHVGSVMAAYNRVNGQYCCENEFLLNQMLRREWGFDGFVTSDFGAVHSTAPCIQAGLDLEMPTGKYFGVLLKKAVVSGEIRMSLLDDKLANRFRTMMRFGVWDKLPDYHEIPAKDAELAMELGAEGVVLLKNDGQLLPLKAGSLHSIALIGPLAVKAMTGGGGSSHVMPTLTVNPIEGIQKFAGDHIGIQVDNGRDIAKAVTLAKGADVAVLMLGDHQEEGKDHSLALAGNQTELAKAVLAANPHTIVVLKTGGPVLMPWADQAPAILETWYPGEEDGNVVAAVIFGAINPSGKLPVTFPENESDLPQQSPAQYPGLKGEVHYSEGVLVGYRWYDAKQIRPLFPFGHGLSYTTFSYGTLKVSPPDSKGEVTVEFDITNTGSRAGAEVAQLYVGLPSLPGIVQPPRQLKGFQRVELQPGQSAHVTLELNRRALSYWDTETHKWKVAPGAYTVSVAASSRDLRLCGTFTIH